MNKDLYLRRRKAWATAQPQYRNLCTRCHQPQYGCFCPHIERFDPGIKFVILVHPIEFHRRIATGRMSHLCLENSEFLLGQDYTYDLRVQEILAEPQAQSFLLYPGEAATDLTSLSLSERVSILDTQKKPVIFVIDGTWATARKTIRQSENLSRLPRICFTPPTESNFRVRKQPRSGFYSTIEAIHHTLELLQPKADRPHDRLLKVFDKMVERQLEFIDEAVRNPRESGSRPLQRKLSYR